MFATESHFTRYNNSCKKSRIIREILYRLLSRNGKPGSWTAAYDIQYDTSYKERYREFPARYVPMSRALTVCAATAQPDVSVHFRQAKFYYTDSRYS
jgi:hypothetical protein